MPGRPTNLEASLPPSKLSLEHIEVVFPGVGDAADVQALADLNLDIRDGELVVALGASGCGKTTLLNLIAGFLKPSRGRMLLDGVPITGPGKDRGVVFQRHALMPWLNVLENAAFGLKLQGVSKAERNDRAKAVLAQVDLSGFENHRIWHLSGGMRQRLGIARVLAADPEIMLMDEPFGALDALTRETMQELLLRIWNASGKTVFFITHSVDEALFLATELLVLSPRPGRIIHQERLPFSKEFLEGADTRKLKSRQDYIDARERVYAMVREGAMTDG